MGRSRFTTQQVARALISAGGHHGRAARILRRAKRVPYTRSAVTKYVARSVELRELIDQIEEIIGDDAEARLLADIQRGSESALLFYLSTKGKHRGYTFEVLR